MNEQRWTRIGTAFPHKEGPGFNIELRAFPITEDSLLSRPISLRIVPNNLMARDGKTQINDVKRRQTHFRAAPSARGVRSPNRPDRNTSNPDLGALPVTYCKCRRDGPERLSQWPSSILSPTPGSMDVIVRVSKRQKSRTHGCVRIPGNADVSLGP